MERVGPRRPRAEADEVVAGVVVVVATARGRALGARLRVVLHVHEVDGVRGDGDAGRRIERPAVHGCRADRAAAVVVAAAGRERLERRALESAREARRGARSVTATRCVTSAAAAAPTPDAPATVAHAAAAAPVHVAFQRGERRARHVRARALARAEGRKSAGSQPRTRARRLKRVAEPGLTTTSAQSG